MSGKNHLDKESDFNIVARMFLSIKPVTNRWPLIDAIKVGDVYYIYYDINGGPGGMGLLQGTITSLE